LELHDLALKDLHLESVEHECPRHREAEGPHIATLLEEVPERISIDTKARLRKEARVGGRGRCLRRGGGVTRGAAPGGGVAAGGAVGTRALASAAAATGPRSA